MKVNWTFAGIVALAVTASAASADERPEFKSQRWQEDWRALCDPARQTEFLDPLKCIPLGPPGTTLTFGGELRERFETVWNPTFGFDGVGKEDVLLTRMLLHADLRFQDSARVFLQLGSHLATDREFGNGPTDRNRLDLQQGFVDLSGKIDAGTRLTLRGGRQEMSFGSSRLVSVRESPNVRRSFDGARAMLTGEGYRVDALAVRPIELEDGVFDDKTDYSTALWGLYGTITAGLPKGQSLDLYYLGYEREDAEFGQATANERRHSLGTRYAGKRSGFDWDVEAVYQFGDFGSDRISAWTVASDLGYTVNTLPWTPRLGLKANIASGDHDPADGKLGTFNALFPKLPYFTEANLVAPANFMDLHPQLTLTPIEGLEVAVGWDVLWKAETADAFYAPPLVPVAGTAGTDRFIGHQLSLDLSYEITPQISLAASYVHFWAGDGLKEAGGRDGDFVALWSSLKF